MDILFASSMCSYAEQKRIFEQFGQLASYASQRFNHLFVQGLAENKCSITALTYEHIPTDTPFYRDSFSEKEDGIDYYYLPFGLNKIKTILQAKKYVTSWCSKHKNGIIICDTIIGELSIAINLANLHGCKKIALVTDVPLIRANDNRSGIRKLPVILKQNQIYKFDGFVFLTKQMNGDLNRKNKPFVIVEGIAQNKASEKVEKIPKSCMMAGMLEDVFGVRLLIDAFKYADVEGSSLYFYGYGTSIEEIVDESKSDSRIHYSGQLPNDQMFETEQKATLLINPRPSKVKFTAYSFPSKNMEYMSSGTPLVAFKLPGIPDEYDPYYFRISDDNPVIFGEQLRSWLNMSDADLTAFGQSSKEWVINEKSPVKQAKKVIMMINESFL